ncbi:hypothetical protein [Mesorhizobium sp.]|uniref:hypothetical protein n=1 Tax=Mesorhizobium sp. TaxID=1871066 RepID=UPI0025CE6479|nr:hypothetical protein [Mesorhizobium sp.]
MRILWLSLLLPVSFGLSVSLGAVSSQSLAGETSADQILDHFEHTDQWRGHRMISARRAGSLQAGNRLYAENSLAAAGASIATGALVAQADELMVAADLMTATGYRVRHAKTGVHS